MIEPVHCALLPDCESHSGCGHPVPPSGGDLLVVDQKKQRQEVEMASRLVVGRERYGMLPRL